MIDPTYRQLPFEEALAWLRQKVPMPTERWDDLIGAAQEWAFTISGVTQAQLLQEALDLVAKAVEEGQLYEDFKQQFAEAFAQRGYSSLNDWRTRLVLMQNMRNAYGAGRWQQQHDPATAQRRPYIIYRHGGSIRPRPAHLALNGFVAMADDPVWNTIHPPNGFNCRCRTFSVNERQLGQEGLSLSDPLPEVTVQDKQSGQRFTTPAVTVDGKRLPVADPGFNTAPGNQAKRQQYIDESLNAMHPSLQAQARQSLGRGGADG